MQQIDYLKELNPPKEFYDMLTKDFLTDFYYEVINAYKFSDIKEGKRPRPYETYSYMGWWINIDLCAIFSECFCSVCKKHGRNDMADYYSSVGYPYSDPLDEYICERMMEYGLMQLENENDIDYVYDMVEYTPPKEIDRELDYHFVSILYDKYLNSEVMTSDEANAKNGRHYYFDNKEKYVKALYETCEEHDCLEVFQYYDQLEETDKNEFDDYIADLMDDFVYLKQSEDIRLRTRTIIVRGDREKCMKVLEKRKFYHIEDGTTFVEIQDGIQGVLNMISHKGLWKEVYKSDGLYYEEWY